MAVWTLDELRNHKQAIVTLASQHGAKNIRVFGSVARGEAGPTSDVDFLVDFEPGRSLFDHGALIMDLQDALSCKVDVLSSRQLRDRLRLRIEHEAVAL